jgi:CRP/FNR family cyclic AMP-dependent transcriptional regulator
VFVVGQRQAVARQRRLRLDADEQGYQSQVGTLVSLGHFGMPPVSLAPLDSVGWLSQQPVAFKAWVGRVGRWRSFAPGQVLYQAGDPADGLYGLAEGSLELTFPLVAEEPVVIYRAEIGFWIGDNAELADVPRLVSLTAASPSRVLYVPGESVRQLLSQYPENWQCFYRLSSINVGTALTLLSESLALTVRARVCRRLLSLSAGPGEATITQEDLAKLVGVARTTLRRALSELAELGAVELGYRKVRVVDRKLLSDQRNEQ